MGWIHRDNTPPRRTQATRMVAKDNYKPCELAEYFNVDVRTIYRWVEEGEFTVVKRLPGGRIRIPYESFLEFNAKKP